MKLLLISALFICNAYSGLLVKKTLFNGKENIISVKRINTEVLKPKVIKKIREYISEKDKTEESYYIESLEPVDSKYKNLLTHKKRSHLFVAHEVRKIINTGNDSNRITLTFLGDGYTILEKEKYFSDVKALVKDMFEEVTFKSYLKLFNIYAIFVASEESGISDIKTKRTAFDLYRSPKGSKRGIMPGNKRAIEDALELIDAHTDYPIIIANDDYYGGLGGRYAIATRSKTSGAMVLRHELGHNFSNVGEEYDGGQVYSGANFSSSKNVPWTHWIKDKLEVHNSEFLTGSYVWQDLSKKDFKINFNFPHDSKYFYELKLSSVGWKSKDDVKVYLDGKELEINGVYTKDRSFFRTKRVYLSKGEHELKIVDNNRDGDNVLAYANGYAYPQSYDFSKSKVGAFNVFANDGRQRGYRPTHNICLMRDMRSKVFCPIDQENIWLQFLSRISLIDKIEQSGENYTVKTLDIEKLSIRWFKKKKGWGASKEEIKELAGKWSVNLKKYGKGKFYPTVSLSHPEIRKKSEHTIDEKEIRIK
ncbi:MAG: M64 family metallopeptidase [Bacteriovoracaceae bacterium]|jgi:hypothetical protein|nr:M64 family metallopeptidase [Bacteriovoracaceae bacterium]